MLACIIPVVVTGVMFTTISVEVEETTAPSLGAPVAVRACRDMPYRGWRELR
jgi:hypothetical protein